MTRFALLCLLWSALAATYAVAQAARRHSVAIIGAGPAGSSLAYFLSRSFPDWSIHVYEANGRVGGRCYSDTFVVDDKRNVTVEWGASIISTQNRYLGHYAREFGLVARVKNASLPTSERLVLWDGSKIVFSLDHGGNSARDLAKILWRYGTSPMWIRRYANEAAARLDAFYEADLAALPASSPLMQEQQVLVAEHTHIHLAATTPGYTTWSALVKALQLDVYLNLTAHEFTRRRKWIKPNFVNEGLEAETRVNYGHNLDQVHPLAALVGFVKGSFYSVEGGNQRIFEEFIRRSNAKVHLNAPITSVKSVSQDADEDDDDGDERGGYIITTAKNQTRRHDLVVLATGELHRSGIDLDRPLPFPPVPYNHIHVTHVLGVINSRQFPGTPPPAHILSLRGADTCSSDGHCLSHVTSVSTIAAFPTLGVSLFKVFSKRALDDDDLRALFSVYERVARREWDSYPVMSPLDAGASLEQWMPPLQLAPGLWYLNGMERLLSTMETQVIASKNLVRLLQNQGQGVTDDAVVAGRKRDMV
ncbi:hypothetical protein RI367_005016 [Sorochytrium milnesiophthora]